MGIFALIIFIVGYVIYLIIEGISQTNNSDKSTNKNTVQINLRNIDKIQNIKKCKDDYFEYFIYEGEHPYAEIGRYISFDKVDLLEIPEQIEGVKITSIGKEAFYNNKLLNKVILPNSITHINERAFSWSSITEIVVGSNVIYYGTRAFSWCNQLHNFDGLNKSGITIEPEAFAHVTMKELRIRNDMILTTSSFEGVQTEKIYLEEGIRFLYEKEFQFSSFDQIRIPTSISVIPAKCFWGNNKLKKIAIPSSVINIADDAFLYHDTTYIKKSDGTRDMRYNPITRKEKLKVTIYCEAGSYAQEFATLNGYKCRPISEYLE